MKKLMAAFAVAIFVMLLPFELKAVDFDERPSQSFFGGRYVIKNDDSLWDLAQDEPCMILENVDTLKIGNRITEKNFFAVCKDGTLWVWGENTHGSLGTGTKEYQEKPAKILDDVTSVSFAQYNTFALKKDASLWAWGKNDPCLGMKTEEDQLAPVKIMDGVKTVYTPVSLAVFAKCEDDTLWGWGHNYDLIDRGGSVLGIKTQESVQYTPIKIMDDVKTMDAIITTPGVGAFVYRAMVVKNDGALWGWGDDNGQMPPHDIKDNGVPVLMLEKVRDIDMKPNYTSVIDSDDNVWIYARFPKGHIGPYSLGWSEKIEKCIGSGIKMILPWLYTLTEDETVTSWTYMLMEDGTIKRFSDSEEEILADHTVDIYSSGQAGTMFFFKKEDCSLWRYSNDHEDDGAFSEKVMDDVEKFHSESGSSYVIKTDGSLWVWGWWPYMSENEIEIPTKVFDGVRIHSMVRVYVNGVRVEAKEAYIKDGRTMLPMWAIFEALGAEVTWDNEAKCAIAIKDGAEVKITIGEAALYKNGEKIALDASAEIVNDRTMVPVRAIAEAFGANVTWDNDNRCVIITQEG